MSCGILEDKLHLERLRGEYQNAFEHWALQVRYLQAVADAAPDVVVKEAEARVSEAQASYRDSRDRLIESLLHVRAETNACRESRAVRATA